MVLLSLVPLGDLEIKRVRIGMWNKSRKEQNVFYKHITGSTRILELVLDNSVKNCLRMLAVVSLECCINF